jgi:hypothetical protein
MIKEPYYLLTEDDPQQAESIRKSLSKLIGPSFTIQWIGSEAAAQDWLSSIDAGSVAPPRGWVGDAMMLFTPPEPDAPRPSKAVLKEGIARAGERLRRQARKIQAMRRVPLVFYSAIRQETAGFEGRDKIAAYLSKVARVQAVLDKLKELEDQARQLSDDDIDTTPWSESAEQETERLNSDPEIRRAIIDGLKFPWSDCKPFMPAVA